MGQKLIGRSIRPCDNTLWVAPRARRGLSGTIGRVLESPHDLSYGVERPEGRVPALIVAGVLVVAGGWACLLLATIWTRVTTDVPTGGPEPGTRRLLLSLAICMLTPPTLLAAVAAWLAVGRRRRGWVLACVIALGILAAFVAFGTIANVGEALANGRRPWRFVLAFGTGGAALAGVLVAGCVSGARWLRRTRAS